MSVPAFTEWLAGAQILIVDDLDANIRLLKRVFELQGWRNAMGVEDARLVVDTVRATTPDLVLLDIRMPHVTGLDLVDTLLPVTENACIPVAVVTADPSRELHAAVRARGVRDVLVKPFELRELVTRARTLLEFRWQMLQHREPSVESLQERR